MTERPRINHCSPEELADYFAQKLTREQAEEVESHLSDCLACAKQAFLVQQFENAWNNWTAKSQHDAFLKERLNRVLKAAEQQSLSDAMGARLRAWRERSGQLVEGALQVVVGAAGQASKVLGDTLERAMRGPLPSPRPVRVRGVRGTGKQPPRPQESEIRVVGKWGPGWHVVVDGQKHEIRVTLNDWPDSKPTPLILLEPEDPEAQPVVGEEQTPSEGDHPIVRFRGLQPGAYRIWHEPVDKSG